MKGSKNDLERIDAIMNTAIGIGIKLPRNLILFNRGKSFLEKQILDTNRKLDQLDPEKKKNRADLLSIYTGVMVSHPGQLISNFITPNRQ
ncbi:hypothetical protein [Endozoicomonas ascidiicola]|nr:hypothetical protein [Endozoicomonas ascidiicola]